MDQKAERFRDKMLEKSLPVKSINKRRIIKEMRDFLKKLKDLKLSCAR